MKLLRFDQHRAINEAVDLLEVLRKDYPEFVRELRGHTLDDRLLAAITAGREDGRPDDERIEFPTGTVAIEASKLRPTQDEIDVDKSLLKSLACADASQLRDMVAGRPVLLGTPVLTLNGQWIIDGHHRWSQLYAMNPKGRVVCLDMRTKEKADPIDVLKAMQMAILATLRRIPTEVVRGTNLLDIGERDLKAYVAERSAENFLKAMDMTPDEAASAVWDNVRTMQRLARPADGAPGRDVMPQSGEVVKSGEFQNAMRTGRVNFKDPV